MEVQYGVTFWSISVPKMTGHFLAMAQKSKWEGILAEAGRTTLCHYPQTARLLLQADTPHICYASCWSMLPGVLSVCSTGACYQTCLEPLIKMVWPQPVPPASQSISQSVGQSVPKRSWYVPGRELAALHFELAQGRQWGTVLGQDSYGETHQAYCHVGINPAQLGSRGGSEARQR